MVDSSGSGITDNILRNIGNSRNNLQSSITRIASGKKFATAGDDPVGNAVSTRLRSQIATLSQAGQNTQAGANLVRTAEGGLSTLSDLASRGRELSLQAASGTLNSSQRQAISNELNSITGEIDRVSRSASFNGQNLLDGSLAPDSNTRLDIQVGDSGNPADRLNLNVIRDTGAKSLGLQGIDVSSSQGALDAATKFEQAGNAISAIRGEVGSVAGRLESVAGGLAQRLEGLTRAESDLSGADLAGEATSLRQSLLQTQTSLRALAIVNEQKGQLGRLLNTVG